MWCVGSAWKRERAREAPPQNPGCPDRHHSVRVVLPSTGDTLRLLLECLLPGLRLLLECLGRSLPILPCLGLLLHCLLPCLRLLLECLGRSLPILPCLGLLPGLLGLRASSLASDSLMNLSISGPIFRAMSLGLSSERCTLRSAPLSRHGDRHR